MISLEEASSILMEFSSFPKWHLNLVGRVRRGLIGFVGRSLRLTLITRKLRLSSILLLPPQLLRNDSRPKREIAIDQNTSQ